MIVIKFVLKTGHFKTLNPSHFLLSTRTPKMALKTLLRVFPLSDLHLEYYSSASKLLTVLQPKLPRADVLVLAGDIGYPVGTEGEKYRDLLRVFQQQFKHVLLVPGNHEYYKMPLGSPVLRRLAESVGVHLLDRDRVDIDGVSFFGTTLWSAIDHQLSKRLPSAFSSHLAYLEAFLECYRWLRNSLAQPGSERQVVVTHHLPAYQLLAPRFANSPFRSAFASDAFWSLPTENVNYWFSGHCHVAMKQKLRQTWFVRNPVGYPNEQNNFNISCQPETFEV